MAQKRKRSDALPDTLEDRSSTSRKLTTACTECRKQKIKCDMVDEVPLCTRCTRRGLACVLHTPFRNHGHDHKQVIHLAKDVGNIHMLIGRLCQRMDIEQPLPLLSETPDIDNDTVQQIPANDDCACELSPPASPSTMTAPMDAYLTDAQAEGLPMSQRARRQTNDQGDLISKGVISLDQAATLVDFYLLRLDRFLYGIASQYANVEEVRRASPALLAAICAVTAFQDVSKRDLFAVCNRAYREIISSSLFEKRNVEYIRALCISSFWLPDASRILISDAARRSADCRLARHFNRLKGSIASPRESKEDARDCVKLFYLLFICDQHLSILHNRDCIIRADRMILEERDQFLEDTRANSQDIRLLSQVSLLVIMGQVRDVFNNDEAGTVPKSLGVQFTHFTRELDRWYARFVPMFEPDPQIGAFPLAGLTMHHQFGKLYLGSHVFRGLGNDPLPLHFLAPASSAHEAATTIFTMIVENGAFCANLIGMPHYFHIMISFAGHFLLDVCTKYREQLDLNLEEDFRRVSAALALFTRLDVLPQHPLSRVTTGLMRRLSECTVTLGIDSVLTGSPFGALGGQYAMARDFGLNGPMIAAGASSTDWQMDAAGTMGTSFHPDEFLSLDFGNFAFLEDPHSIP